MVKKTPLKAIRKFCLECAANHVGVRTCPANTCHLWGYRFGMSLRRYEKKKVWKSS